MALLNSKGEVANFTDVSQFEGGESAYECGFYTVYVNAGAGQPPLGRPRFGAEEIDQLADAAYKRYWGNNLPSNKNGMSLYQLYQLLTEEHLFYPECPIQVNLHVIRGYLDHGYGVILTVAEDSVYDLELGDKVPYAWKPSGNHLITAVGYSGSDTLLCLDTASIAPTGVRPDPRKVDAGKLSVSNATVVVYPWLQRPGPDFDPSSPPEHGENSYTVQPGDVLWNIAGKLGTSVAQLLAANKAMLDKEAQERGYRDSFDGGLIFPGEVLTWE